jgi:hypothetical protein
VSRAITSTVVIAVILIVWYLLAYPDMSASHIIVESIR